MPRRSLKRQDRERIGEAFEIAVVVGPQAFVGDADDRARNLITRVGSHENERWCELVAVLSEMRAVEIVWAARCRWRSRDMPVGEFAYALDFLDLLCLYYRPAIGTLGDVARVGSHDGVRCGRHMFALRFRSSVVARHNG